MPKQAVKVREIEDGLEGAPTWITTFVDMVSLLVTFFILLYTFASLKDYETFTIPKNLIGTRGQNPPSGDTISAPEEDLMLAMDLERGSRTRHTRPVDQLEENLEEMGQKLTEDHLEVNLRSVADGIVVRFDEEAGFGPGSAIVNETLRRSLIELADAVEHYPLMVLVEGHTDDAFQPSSRYPTADALSLARAKAAADVMAFDGNFDPALIQLAGYGADRPRDPEARTARERSVNRRVEVRILSMSKDRAAHHEKDLEDGPR